MRDEPPCETGFRDTPHAGAMILPRATDCNEERPLSPVGSVTPNVLGKHLQPQPATELRY